MRKFVVLALVGSMVAAAAPAAQAQGIGGLINGAREIDGLLNGGKNRNKKNDALGMIERAALLSTLSNPQVDPSMSTSQTQIHGYANANYKMQGAVGGSLIGAIAGCLIADGLLDKNCGDGALLGAVLGGGIGYVVGGNAQKRQEVYASTENNLTAKLQAAEQDLADARATREAAEMLVAEHRSTLASLQQKRNRNQISREQYAKEVGYMVKDVEALGAAKKGLEGQLTSLNAAIANTTEPAESSKLTAVYVKLQAEDQALDKALRSLSGMVEGAKV